jgi:RNA polymerase sigma-70 factor (ECF subfamily)
MFRTTGPERQELDFESLYCANCDAIFGFCFRLCGNRAEAEDLTQEVFVAALEGLHRFERRSSPKTWLFRIALYRYRAHRDRHERKNISIEVAPEPLSRDNTGSEIWRIAIQEALMKLPRELREAFVLVKCEGFTCAEAAKVVRVPLGTLKFRVYRAVKSLQLLLTELPEVSNEL